MSLAALGPFSMSTGDAPQMPENPRVEVVAAAVVVKKTVATADSRIVLRREIVANRAGTEKPGEGIRGGPTCHKVID